MSRPWYSYGIWLMWPKSSQADWNVGNILLAGKNPENLSLWGWHICNDPNVELQNQWWKYISQPTKKHLNMNILTKMSQQIQIWCPTASWNVVFPRRFRTHMKLKSLMTFHYTDWLIGILTMTKRLVIIPYITGNNQPGGPQGHSPGICPALLCTVFVRASAKAKRCSSTWASKDTGAPTPDQTLSLTGWMFGCKMRRTAGSPLRIFEVRLEGTIFKRNV